MNNEIETAPTVKLGELLPKKFHDQVMPESLGIEVPKDEFMGIIVEVKESVHLWNKEKSNELIFGPIPDDPEDPRDEDEPEILLNHKIYVDGVGKTTGVIIQYLDNGEIGYGQFLIE